MKVLFLHAATETSPEYNVHNLLAKNANPDILNCYFVVQKGSNIEDKSNVFYWNFGRNMSLSPKPSKLRRAFMMLWRLPFSLIYLASVLIKIRPEVIYTSQQWFDLFLVNILKVFFKTKHIIHIHYPIDPSLGNSTVRTILKNKNLIAVSDFVRQSVIEVGLNPDLIKTLHNPVDNEKYSSSEKNSSLRNEFGWPTNTLIIVSAGRLDEKKGHAALIDAYHEVRKKITNVKLIICGETTSRSNYSDSLKEEVRLLNLENEVVFVGYRKDMPQVYSGADLFCLPSIDEAFGLVYVEAMFSGLPVIAFSSGAVPEIVLDGKTGLLCSPGDMVALSKSIVNLLENRSLACELGENGKERAYNEFSPKVITPKWERIITDYLTK